MADKRTGPDRLTWRQHAQPWDITVDDDVISIVAGYSCVRSTH